MKLCVGYRSTTDLFTTGNGYSESRIWQCFGPRSRPYVCTIGSNGTDYKTLRQAPCLLPHIPVVVVALPENLKDIAVPKNVRLLVDAPLREAMNMLKFSEFTVLPLLSSTTPCGHVT